MKTSVPRRLFSPYIARTIRSYLAWLSLVFVLALTGQTSHAGSATWKTNPGSNDWNAAANWTPVTVPNDPADTATFGSSNTTSISLSAETDVAGITFNSGASAFTITRGLDLNLFISGLGITNNSGLTQKFSTIPGDTNFASEIFFLNSAMAGSLTMFTNNGSNDSFSFGVTVFGNTSSAGNATFVNNGGIAGNIAGGSTQFGGNSTAGNGVFTTNGGTVANAREAFLYFYDDSSAGNGVFTTNGGAANGASGGLVDFFFNPTAGNGSFTNNGGTTSGAGGANMYFENTSKASNATIINNGGTVDGAGGAFTGFFSTASANSAILIANGGPGEAFGGNIAFYESSTGGTARVKVFGDGIFDDGFFNDGIFDISFHNPPGLTVGSIEGNGLIQVGSNTLTVGTNNLSTSFSGFIDDFGLRGGFTKTGSGVLTFEGRTDNNYLGDTITLSLVGSSVLNLNFNGTDTIGGLIVNGIVQNPGLYGSGTAASRGGQPGDESSVSGLIGNGNVLVVLPVAVSRKIQGTSARDIYLPMTGNAGVECRSPGANNSYQLVVTFLNPVTFASAGVTTGSGMVTSAIGSGTNVATINLAGVDNAQTITVTLFRVNDGVSTSNVKVSMSVLVGDVNGNRAVTSSDIAQVKSQSGQTANSSNYRADVNGNGQINSSDVALVKLRSGTGINTEYSQNFDTGIASGFTFNGLWHITQNYPASGSYSLGFVQNETVSATPNGNYNTGATLDQIAFSGPITVPETNPTLTFGAFVGDEWDQQPNDFDRLSVWVSTDGVTLSQVVASSEPYIGGAFIPEWFGPGTEQYNPIFVDLFGYNGQVIYLAFRFETLDPVFNNYPGARVDDIHIFSGAASISQARAGNRRLDKAVMRERKLRETIAKAREMKKARVARIPSTVSRQKKEPTAGARR